MARDTMMIAHMALTCSPFGFLAELRSVIGVCEPDTIVTDEVEDIDG